MAQRIGIQQPDEARDRRTVGKNGEEGHVVHARRESE
jgi:hypothetical protein